MSDQLKRSEVLRKLIEFSLPLGEIKKLLSYFSWDFDGREEAVSSSNVVNVIQRYVDDQLSSDEIESWANLIEGREDLVFDPRCPGLLQDVIHELANPVLSGSLSKRRAKELIRNLSIRIV